VPPVSPYGRLAVRCRAVDERGRVEQSGVSILKPEAAALHHFENGSNPDLEECRLCCHFRSGTLGAQFVEVASSDFRPRRPAPDQREHPGRASLLLLGVMLLFWGVLLVAELRELGAWHARSEPCDLPLAAAGLLAQDGASSLDLSNRGVDMRRAALTNFGWAQLVAGLGAAMGVLNLRARREAWWVTFTLLALVCLLTSSHLFTVARAQLPARALAEP